MRDEDRVRRRRRRGAAAVLVVAVAAGVAVGAVLPGSQGGGTRATGAGHERSRAAAAWYPAGPLPAADAEPTVAPYFVTVVFQRSPAPVTVNNAFTGQVLATVSAPVPGLGFGGVAAQTGQPLAVVSPRADESGMGSSCLALWTDPSGDQLTAECGQVNGGLTIVGGHFAPADLHVPSYNFSTGRQIFIAW